MTRAALTGTKVLDLTRLLPGPYATQMLAHWGADVLKVEDRGAGDYARDLHPLRVSGFGAAFTASNRGKRSTALDLKDAQDLRAFHALLQEADVLVESFRPGVMARLGLSPEALLDRFPRLVYCAITGHGQATPRAALAGHDLNYQALAGLLHREGKAPVVPTALLADLVGGSCSAVIAIQGALLARERSGRGVFIDLSITHSALMLQPLLAACHLAGEDTRHAQLRHGGSHPGYRLYETSDGRHIAFAALEAKFWDRFCDLAGCANLRGLADSDDTAVLAQAGEELARIFRLRTFAEWSALSLQWDTCLAPVLSPAEAIDEAVRDQLPLFAELDGLGGGRARVLSGVPADLAAPHPGTWPRPPMQGEHLPGWTR